RTLRDLVPERARATESTDAARIKGYGGLDRAIETAVALYEQPPTESIVVETPWQDVLFRAEDWAEAFDGTEPGVAHDEARDQVWDTIVDILADRRSPGVPERAFRAVVRRDEELIRV